MGAVAGGSKKQDTASTGTTSSGAPKTEPPTSTATSTSSSTTTTTAPPTTTTSPPTTPAPTTPPTSASSEPQLSHKTIPGLVAVDFYGNMTKVGWKCTGPNKSANLANWDCKDPTDPIGTAAVMGWSPTEILKVQIMVSRANAPEVLGYVATLPYTGAQPAEAQAWVKQALTTVSQGNPAETTFGGVPYEVTAAGDTAALSIGRITDP